MSEYSKILSACGWIEGFEELPLVAERIARYSAERIEQLEAAPIKINVKSNEVWITFDAGEGRQAMLCLNNIVKDMHKEGINRGICLDAIRAALQENTDVR